MTTLNVTMPDKSTYPVGTLLTDGKRNVKLSKSDAADVGIETVGLTLAPADESGFNVCPLASLGCKAGCLKFSGHNTFSAVRRSQVAKTRALFQHKAEFVAKLTDEIARAKRLAEKRGNRLAVRLNVLSDLRWEQIAPSLFSQFSDVQFYDYTKVPNRQTPANYHLTFSRSESNETTALAEYARGKNVAVVFESADLPATWNGIPVFSGDETDLRFRDKRGIVGLYAKGKGKRDATGFVVRPVAS